jgi:hypothetical protein
LPGRDAAWTSLRKSQNCWRFIGLDEQESNCVFEQEPFFDHYLHIMPAGEGLLFFGPAMHLRGEKADALATKQVGLHEQEGNICRPITPRGPVVATRRINRLGLNAARGTVGRGLTPERLADGRNIIRVLHADDGVLLKLPIVHTTGKDDVLHAVGIFGADPAHVQAFAGEDLAGALG